MWDPTKYFVKLLSRHIKLHVSIADALELHLFWIKPSLYRDCINYTNVIGFCALLNVDWGDPHHMIATAIVMIIHLIDMITEGMSQLSITGPVVENIAGANGAYLISTPRPWKAVAVTPS